MITTLFYLMVGHALMDFPWQAGPTGVEKSRHSQTALQQEVPWYYWLSAHALLHGGAVAYVTGAVWLGLLETAVHWLIDFAKCEGWMNIHVDQALHVLCKLLWCLLLVAGAPRTL